MMLCGFVGCVLVKFVMEAGMTGLQVERAGGRGAKKGLGTSLTTSSTVLFYCLQSECAGPMNCCEEESQHQGKTGYEKRWDNEFYHKDWCGREGVHIDITALRCSG